MIEEGGRKAAGNVIDSADRASRPGGAPAGYRRAAGQVGPQRSDSTAAGTAPPPRLNGGPVQTPEPASSGSTMTAVP